MKNSMHLAPAAGHSARRTATHLSKRLSLNFLLADHTPVAIRPICPEDEPLVALFHQGLSENTVYQRYFYYFRLDRRTEHERLSTRCVFNCDSEMAFVAERITGEDTEIVGIGRLSRSETEGEVAVVIADAYQGHGIGSALVSRIVSFARELRLERLTASTLLENRAMQRIFEKLGFEFDSSVTSEVVDAQLVLISEPSAQAEEPVELAA